jgi:hypothetical protein
MLPDAETVQKGPMRLLVSTIACPRFAPIGDQAVELLRF